mmetsp:Transcript_65034/g.113388  ORF Transcript_65034/g.113388 Transcript_65034/m.113388 type:complete len:204 (-) Transcript_65034:187-798(-)
MSSASFRNRFHCLARRHFRMGASKIHRFHCSACRHFSVGAARMLLGHLLELWRSLWWGAGAAAGRLHLCHIINLLRMLEVGGLVSGKFGWWHVAIARVALLPSHWRRTLALQMASCQVCCTAGTVVNSWFNWSLPHWIVSCRGPLLAQIWGCGGCRPQGTLFIVDLQSLSHDVSTELGTFCLNGSIGFDASPDFVDSTISFLH